MENCSCHNHNHSHSDNNKRMLIELIAGAALFVAALLITHFTAFKWYIDLVLYLPSYMVLGYKILLESGKNILKGKVFDENFLMTIATIGALVLGEYLEAVAVMLFYQVGEFFSGIAVGKSKKSIIALLDIRPDYANIKSDNGETQKVEPELVQVGDIIIVKSGEKVPLDGIIVSGSGALDARALTGESIPRKVNIGDEVLSGCININGLLEIRVTKLFGESTASKIIELAQNAVSKKAPTEKFITKFARIYTPIVVLAAVMLAVIPPLFLGWSNFTEWVNRALIFLVISCPCALVVSVPLGFFAGIGNASKNGILVKGSNYLEVLNSLHTVVFDKTGTLTKGAFEVCGISAASGFTDNDVIKYATVAEINSNHPIAKAILAAADVKQLEIKEISNYDEIAGRGIKVKYKNDALLAGNALLLKENNVEFTVNTKLGTVVYVALNGAFVGSIVIADTLKPDAISALADLKNNGVCKTIMLTGDNFLTADEIAKNIQIDEFYSDLLPDGKVEKLEKIICEMPQNKKVAFVGDGINDAPVLARADVGIAMGGLGSDAAIEAADVVILTDQPSKINTAIKIAKKTRRIVWQNIFLALGIKAVFLALGAFGLSNMLFAVFADVGVALLAILNSMRAL